MRGFSYIRRSEKTFQMNAIQDHIYAFRSTIDQLSKGSVWLYLVPSLVVAFFFYGIFSFFNNVLSTASTTADWPLIGGLVSAGIEKTVQFSVWISRQFYIFFILTILSPVNCLLSEKMDNQLTGAKFNGGFARILTDIFRAIWIVLFALMLNFVVMGAWALIAWITGFHLLDSLIYFLIGSFFIGFSFYDYSLERYGTGFFGTIGFGFDNMKYMLITGALFTLIYMIPFAGIILAPFLVTIIATIVYLKMTDKITNNHSPNAIQ